MTEPLPKLAETIADHLFADGQGKQAARLVMEYSDSLPIPGTGWSRPAVVSRLTDLIDFRTIRINGDNLEKRIDDAVHTILGCWGDWEDFSQQEAQTEQDPDAYDRNMYDQLFAVIYGMICDRDR